MEDKNVSTYLVLRNGSSLFELPDYAKIENKDVAFIISGEDQSTLVMAEFDPQRNYIAEGEHIVFHGESVLVGREAHKVPCLWFGPEDIAFINAQNAYNKENGQSPMVLYMRDHQVKVFSNDSAFKAYCSGQIER